MATTSRLALLALVLPAMVAAILPAPSTTAAEPTVEGPVNGGVHGRPWFSSLVDLAPHGFVEEEFFLAGTSDDSTYKTRMVVRRPVSQEQFSGTVFVEWVNVTGGRDLETLWPAGHPTILDEGHAYVVVSAQLVGHSELRAWDPVRYATLTHPGDTPGSFHIFEDAIDVIRTPREVDVLGGLAPEYVIGTGDSQSAGRLTTYLTEGYDLSGLDGLVPGRGGGNQATGEVADELELPIIWMLEEDQSERPADTEFQKFWFQAGAAHAPLDWANYVWRSDMRDLAASSPVPDALNAACSMNRGEGHMVRAGVHWINRWVRGLDQPRGAPASYTPPTSPRMERDDAGDLLRDDDGLALGGIRYPYMEAPIGVNTTETCPLFGDYIPFDSGELVERYPTHDDYVDAVTAAADTAVADGFMLDADRTEVVARAEAFDVWSTGAATCHDVNIYVERLHYNSDMEPCPPSSTP